MLLIRAGRRAQKDILFDRTGLAFSLLRPALVVDQFKGEQHDHHDNDTENTDREK